MAHRLHRRRRPHAAPATTWRAICSRRANGLEGEPGLAADLLAAADRLDPEEGEQLPKDEWEIGDRRYRVIRVEKYTLIGDGVMEPPRPTDASPACGSGSALRGFLLDPRAPAGQWEAQLRLNLVGYMPVLGPVPDVIRAEARHAVQSHPAVVLLPPTFTMVEIKDGSWEPITGADDPVRARDHLVEATSPSCCPGCASSRGRPRPPPSSPTGPRPPSRSGRRPATTSPRSAAASAPCASPGCCASAATARRAPARPTRSGTTSPSPADPVRARPARGRPASRYRPGRRLVSRGRSSDAGAGRSCGAARPAARGCPSRWRTAGSPAPCPEGAPGPGRGVRPPTRRR